MHNLHLILDYHLLFLFIFFGVLVPHIYNYCKVCPTPIGVFVPYTYIIIAKFVPHLDVGQDYCRICPTYIYFLFFSLGYFFCIVRIIANFANFSSWCRKPSTRQRWRRRWLVIYRWGCQRMMTCSPMLPSRASCRRRPGIQSCAQTLSHFGLLWVPFRYCCLPKCYWPEHAPAHLDTGGSYAEPS